MTADHRKRPTTAVHPEDRPPAGGGDDDWRFRQFVEQIPGVPYVADPTDPDRTLFVSPRVEDLLGYSPSELLTAPGGFASRIHPEDRERVEEAFRQAPEAGLPFRCEYRLLARDGRAVWVRDEAILVAAGPEGEELIHGVMLDITGRVEAETRADEQRALFEAIVSAIGDGVSMQDRDFRVLYQNDAHRRLFGNCLGKHCYRAYRGRETVCAGCGVQQAFEDGKVHRTEMRNTAIDPDRHVEITSSPLFDASGEVVAAIEVVRDISERRRMEAALQESEARYRSFLEHFVGIAFRAALDFRPFFFHGAVESITGYTEAELASGNPSWDRVVHPEDRPAFLRVAEALITEPGCSREQEYRILRKDGDVRWVHELSRNVCDGSGRVESIQGAIYDITARKLGEERAQVSEAALDSTVSGVAFADLSGALTRVNPAFLSLWGYETEAEVLGRPAVEFWEDPREPRAVIETLRDRGSWVGELTAVRRDGTTFPAQLTANLIRDDAGRPVSLFASFLDVSERRRLDEELARADKLDSLGLLAGGIAHDFNNILTAILGNVSLARARAEQDPKLQARLDAAEKASLRAQELTQQLLTFSRGGAPVKASASLPELVRESTEFALRGAAVRCAVGVEEGLWPAEVDRGQLSQVVQNLVINADQAMPEGGVIELKLENADLAEGEVPPLPAGRYVKLVVRDRGVGIAPEHLSQVFDPYFTTKSQGSGLGLATCYSIVQRHGGHIAVASDPGTGATFTVHLPAAETPPELRAEEPQRDLPAGSGRILVMDDEEAVRSVAGEMLRELGYRVEETRDGAEAVARYRSALFAGEPFDAVIMDLTVPGAQGGRETLAQLQRLHPEVTAIVSSGYSTDPVLAAFQEHGFAARLAKPYGISDLAATLAKLVGTPPG